MMRLLAHRALSRVLVVAAVVALLASSASATQIILSNLSSDSTPAGQLDALLDFDVSGTTLTLTATNNTGGGAAFDINEIYFNALSSLTGLTLLSATKNGSTDVLAGWTFSSSVGANGFGTFDFALIDGVGVANPEQIDPGSSIEFVFDINGGASFSPVDLSIIPPGSEAAFAAAKFVQCVGAQCVEIVDSAFGATSDPSFVIPEPASLSLLGLGLLAVAVRSRRV